MNVRTVLRGLVIVALTATVVAPAAADIAPSRTPVVLFPAYHLTKLQVTVRDQNTAPDCPRSGSFEYWFQNDHPSATFSQTCQDELLTLRYTPDPDTPMAARFAEQRGVTVRVVDFGRTTSAPFYEPMYRALESVGYVRNKGIRVAGYDARLTPDMAGFLGRARKLVEDTYRDNGNRPVHLVGHSNGPLYAQYLLTHTSREWRAKYVHGFTPIAGNFPGQGLLYSMLFTGLNIQDFTYPKTTVQAATSARLYLTAPSTYMSAADPAVFGDRETIIEDTATGRAYTPRDRAALFADAHLPFATEIADHYVGFVDFAGPRSFPYVDVAAEKGSGLATIVGARLPGLTTGQLVDAGQFLTRDGDVNQEDITNDAVLAWGAMRCYRFSLTDNPGVDHFALPSDPGLLDRLLDELNRRPSHCAAIAAAEAGS